MMMVIHKRHLACAALCACCAAALLVGEHAISKPVFAPSGGAPAVVVIDAGHGGEDGGAVSADGVQESRINLEIALRCNDLLRLSGRQTSLIRREDVSVHTEGETIRARKASDIRNRVALVEQHKRPLLLSIHQNSLPSSPVTHGAQVFWNSGSGADEMANVMQDALNLWINTERPKQSKKIPSTIYLMNHVTAPAVLVECGFLTNEAETALLQQPSHQKKLAAAITAGVLCALSGEEML